MSAYYLILAGFILAAGCTCGQGRQDALQPVSGNQRPDTAWQELFNHRDLAGWEHVGDGYMTAEDGIIRTHGGMGLLYWKGGKLGNCTIHVEWRMEKENSNSGVFTRIPIEPREAWMPVYYGHEILRRIYQDPH